MNTRILLIILLILGILGILQCITSELNTLKNRVQTLEQQVNTAPVLESTPGGWARFKEGVDVEVVPYNKEGE